MKRFLLLNMLLSATLILSCSKQEVTDLSEGDRAMSFNASVTETKVVTDMKLDSYFEEGDAIGIFVVLRDDYTEQDYPSAEGNYAHNVKWVRNSEGRWQAASEADRVFFPQEGVVDVYAYYPYMEGADPTDLKYDASEKMCDFMTARAVAVFNNTNEPVELAFEHKLAMVQADIVILEQKLSSLEASINDLLLKASIDLSAKNPDEEVTTEEGDLGSVPLLKDGSVGVLRAYIPAQTVPYGTMLFNITTPEGEFLHRTEEEIEFRPSEAKRFSIATSYESFGDPLLLPNCYIINPGDAMVISAQKAMEVWKTHPILTLQDAPFSGEMGAKLVWQDRPDLIQNVELVGTSENVGIRIGTNDGIAGGNAVVALTVNGVARWSWHIWVTDFDPEAAENQFTNNGFTLMDRNLGAVSEDKDTVDITGLCYQWGRKDPFIGVADFVSLGVRPIYDMRGAEKQQYTTANQYDAAPNLIFSIENPEIFIFGADSDLGTYDNTMDWYSINPEEKGADRWHSEKGEKTVWDPCPKGWRVPAYNTAEDSPWAGFVESQEATGVDLGFGFFPFGAYRHSNDGRIYNFAKNKAMHWSAVMGTPENPYSKTARYGRGLMVSQWGWPSAINALDESFPVGTAAYIRCVKE